MGVMVKRDITFHQPPRDLSPHITADSTVPRRILQGRTMAPVIRQSDRAEDEKGEKLATLVASPFRPRRWWLLAGPPRANPTAKGARLRP